MTRLVIVGAVLTVCFLVVQVEQVHATCAECCLTGKCDAAYNFRPGRCCGVQRQAESSNNATIVYCCPFPSRRCLATARGPACEKVPAIGGKKTTSRHDTTWTFVLIGVAVVASVVLLYLCWTCCTQGCRSIVPSQGSRPGSARGGAENDGGEVGGGGEGGRRRRGSSADGEEQAGGGRRNQDALMRAVRSSGRPLVVDRVSSSGSNNIGSNPRHNSNYDNVSIRNADLNTPRMESSPREGVEGISRPYRRSGPDRGRYQTQLQQLQPQRERNQQQNSADDDKNDNATVQPLPSSPFPPAPLSQSPQEYSWRHPQPPVTMIHEEKQHNSKNITTSTPSLALSVTPPPPSIPYSAFSTPSSCPPVLTPISTSSGPPPAPPTPLTSTLPQPLPSHVPSSDPSTPTTATRTALPGSLIHVNPPGGPDLVPSIPPRPILTTGTGSS